MAVKKVVESKSSLREMAYLDTRLVSPDGRELKGFDLELDLNLSPKQKKYGRNLYRIRGTKSEIKRWIKHMGKVNLGDELGYDEEFYEIEGDDRDFKEFDINIESLTESDNPKSWSNNKILTYKEAQSLALAYYNQGGDSFYECWDEKEFNEFIEIEGRPMTVGSMKSMFRMYDEVDRDMRGSGQYQESFQSPVDAAEYYYSTPMDDCEIENDLKSSGHDDKFVKDVLNHMDEIFDEEERNNVTSCRFNESAKSYHLADYSMKDIKNVLDNALKSASQITVVYKDSLSGQSYLSYKRDGDSWTFVNEKGQVMNRGTQNERSSTGLSKNYVYRNLVYALNNKNVVELKIQESLKESGSDEEVTVGIYGDEVPGFKSVDDLVVHFEKKGIRVVDREGDMESGWDMILEGNPRALFFAVVNVIPGYNSDSVKEFIDQYRIDESLNEDMSITNYEEILRNVTDGVQVDGKVNRNLGTNDLEISINPDDDSINQVIVNATSLGFKESDRFIDDREGSHVNDSYVVFTKKFDEGRCVLAIVFNAANNYAFVTAGDSEEYDDYFEESLKEGYVRVRYKDEDSGSRSQTLFRTSVEEMKKALDQYAVDREDIITVEGCTEEELFESLTEDKIESSGAREFVVTLTVKMEKYNSDEPAEFDFNVDTNEVGEVVLTPVDKNSHFTEVKVQKKD